VVTQLPDQPDVQPYHGRDGALRAMPSGLDMGRLLDRSASHERDRDGVLVSCRRRGRGKGSGVEMEGEVHFVFTVRRGKIVRWQMFPSERQALEVVGAPGEVTTGRRG
jgi:ketosteroid isomerase-like protein